VADKCGACKPGFIGEGGNSNGLGVDFNRQSNNNNSSAAGGGGGGLKGFSEIVTVLYSNVVMCPVVPVGFHQRLA
jgi:hypothetical protein